MAVGVFLVRFEEGALKDRARMTERDTSKDRKLEATERTHTKQPLK